MFKKSTVFHIIILLLGFCQFATATEITPPYTGAGTSTVASETGWIAGKAGYYSTSDTDTGRIEQVGIAYAAALGGAGVLIGDIMTGEFSVPVSGVYTVELSGNITYALWSLGDTFLAGAEESEFSIEINGGVQGKSIVKKNIYETVHNVETYLDELKSIAVSQALDSAANAATGFLKTGIEVYQAVNEMMSYLPVVDVDEPFSVSTTLYLDAGTYSWWFDLRSKTIAAAAGISAMYASSVVISDLESVTITSALPYYEVTASSGPNGLINPEGVINVTQGDSLTFNATPEIGYDVEHWEVNGVPVQTGGSSYTLSNVQSDTYVNVTFKEQTDPFADSEICPADEDTTVIESSPDSSSMGNSISICAQNEPSDYYGLVKFDLDDIPNGSTIESVELKLYCSYAAGSLKQITLREIDSSWSESSTTWNNRPPNGSTSIWYTIPGTGYRYIEDSALRSLVEDWVSGDKTNYGLYIYAGEVDDAFCFSSSEDSSSYRPTLTVNFIHPPPPDLIVTNLQPDPNLSSGSFTVGQSVDWEVTVKNIGNGPADSSTVEYYLGISSTDLSNPINSDSTSSLDSGESNTDSDSYTFTTSDIGTRYLICKADNDNDVEESNENNNTRVYGPFTVILPKVSTPVISPDGGAFADSVQVGLSCATPGATIRYTTDGTTPTSTSTIYTGAFTINNSCTVNARGYASSYTDSEISSANFVITPVLVPELSLTPDSRTVDSSSGTTSFLVNNTGSGTLSWTASVVSGESWLSITSGSSGENGGTISVSYIANTESSMRTGTIRVTASGADGSPKEVTIIQESQNNDNNAKIALINPDNFRILKFGFGNWTAENSDPPCDGSYYSAASGTIGDGDLFNPDNWSGVGLQPDYITELLRANGYTVDEYSSSSFPEATSDDYSVVIVQDPLTDNVREFPRSVETELPDLLENVIEESFINKLQNYFNSGGKLILVGDAVRLLEAPSGGKNTLDFGKTILTDQVANSSNHSCAPNIWPFIRANPFCCVDRSGSYTYEVSSTAFSLAGTILSNLTLFNGVDLGPAQIWPDTVYYPSDGISLLDVSVTGTGGFVTRGDICSPPVYPASIDDVLNHFMGYTTYNGREIYYIGSDSFWDYQLRSYRGAWHCSGDNWAEIENQTTETGKEAIVKLVQIAINSDLPVKPSNILWLTLPAILNNSQ